MKVKVIHTAVEEIDESIYQEWLDENGIDKNMSEMTDAEKLEVVQDCEDECGYEICQEIDDWNTEITAA